MVMPIVIWMLFAQSVVVNVSAQGYVSPPTSYNEDGSYDRRAFRHWTDEDRDCQDTRQEVLIAESVIPVTLDTKGCRVLQGEWHDPYTGRVFTDPRQLQVDHVVALGWAYYHGAWQWDKEKKRAFANDLENPEHLIAVFGPANQAKGRLGPDDYKPQNRAHWCQFGRDWMAITQRWDLMLTWREFSAIADLLGTCE
jgi:hypothetical protein